MNTNDKKDALLFEIIKIYDNTIHPFLISKEKNDGEVKSELNFKYLWFWLYFFNILLFLFFLIRFVVYKDLFSIFGILISTVLFVIVVIREQRIPNNKIKEKTGEKKMNVNYYDLFSLNVKNKNSNELKFTIKYIKFLTSDKPNLNIFINVYLLSFIIAFVVNILTENFGNKENIDFVYNIMKSLAAGFIGIIIFNIIRILLLLKKIKLLRLKKFIKYTLLCREIEKINNGP
jgi:hypothetical protein